MAAAPSPRWPWTGCWASWPWRCSARPAPSSGSVAEPVRQVWASRFGAGLAVAVLATLWSDRIYEVAIPATWRRGWLARTRTPAAVGCRLPDGAPHLGCCLCAVGGRASRPRPSGGGSGGRARPPGTARLFLRVHAGRAAARAGADLGRRVWGAARRHRLDARAARRSGVNRICALDALRSPWDRRQPPWGVAVPAQPTFPRSPRGVNRRGPPGPVRYPSWYNPSPVRRDPDQLTGRSFDLLVVGAGIYGATIAWDAALRGLSVALIDRSDFGAATSANSMKTVHGGLRSLQRGNLREMRSFIQDRRAFLRMAPHLVEPITFAVPTTRGLSRHRLAMRAALILNDLVAADRNRGLDPARRLPAGRVVSRDEFLALEPGLDRPASRAARCGRMPRCSARIGSCWASCNRPSPGEPWRPTTWRPCPCAGLPRGSSALRCGTGCRVARATLKRVSWSTLPVPGHRPCRRPGDRASRRSASQRR